MPRSGKAITLIYIFAAAMLLFAPLSLAADEKTAVQPLPKEAAADPDNIVIPRTCGMVVSKFKGSSDRLIIYIQDAHCNYEAQANISKMLDSLVKNYGLSFVSVEGADGQIDTSRFSVFHDEGVRKEIAGYFMKKCEISGPEYFSIMAERPLKLFGAETRSDYIKNLDAFVSSYPLKTEVESYLKSIKKGLDILKRYIYSDDLKRMDENIQSYESRDIQFNTYVRFLQDEARKNRISLAGYKNLSKLIDLLKYEKSIDFGVAEKERGKLVDYFTDKLSKEAIVDFATQSVLFKMNRISSVQYYDQFKDLAAKTRIDLSKTYPNLYRYIIYNSKYSMINDEELLGEIKDAEESINSRLFKNDDQRALEKLSRHINILTGLVNIRLTDDDFNYFAAHKNEFAHAVFADFIKKEASRYRLHIKARPVTRAVDNAISRMESFYAIALKRDKILIDNTLNEMKNAGVRIGVLVAGGFHTPGIARLLEKDNVSYMIISPVITKETPTPYIQVLTGQKIQFERILMGATDDFGGHAMLTPPSIASVVDLNEAEAKKAAINDNNSKDAFRDKKR